MTDSTPADKPTNRGLLAALLQGEKTWSWDWKYNPGLFQHMHALGVVAANYNQLELSLQLLIYLFMGDYQTTAPKYLFSKLSNPEGLDLFRQLYAAKVTNPNFLDRLEWFVSGYGKCVESRNILMHSAPFDPLSPERILTKIQLRKASKSNPAIDNTISLEVGEIRQVADDIAAFDMFGFDTYLYEAATRKGGKITIGSQELTPSLPDKPPAPSNLTLSSLIFGTSNPSQPQSSGE